MDLCPILRQIRKFDDMLDIYVISKSYSVIVKLINWVLLVSPSRSRSVTNTQRISDSPIISDWMHHHPGFVCLFENKLQLASEVDFFSMMMNRNHCWTDFKEQLDTWVNLNSIDDDLGSIMDPSIAPKLLFPYSRHNWLSKLPHYIGRHLLVPHS